VQLDPIKPKLKPPGTKRLKLEYDGMLSDFGFKSNLRRYIKGAELTSKVAALEASLAAATAAAKAKREEYETAKAGADEVAVELTGRADALTRELRSSGAAEEAAEAKATTLEKERDAAEVRVASVSQEAEAAKVGRCRFSLSNPR